MNKDGLDEINLLFSASEFPSQGLVNLWIYSWDGTVGRLISEKNENMEGFSELTGTQKQLPSIFDYDNDGILEVLAKEKSIFKWDSEINLYVYWMDEDF